MFKKAISVLKVSAVMAAATVALLQLQGCGGSGGGGTASKGTLKLSITDKMSHNFADVVIAVKEVRVVPIGMEDAEDSDPRLQIVATFPSPKVIHILDWNFKQMLLGEIALPAGTYSQIRLILERNTGQDPANYVVLINTNTRIPLTTPSGHTSGLKVKGPFVIKPGIINAVMIDFDPTSAINKNYVLNPTGIRLVNMSEMLTEYGSISGTVLSTFKDWSSATVAVKRRGAINDIDPIAAGRIFSSYTSGAWKAPFAAFVPASSPTISYKTFIAANGFRLYSSSVVNVTTGQTTDLGTIPLAKTP